MSDRNYRREYIESARRSPSTFQLTSRLLLALLATFGSISAAVFWWKIQIALTSGDIFMAGSLTAALVIAPPGLLSFIFPWTPAGAYLQRINKYTPGAMLASGMAVYLIYYAYSVLGAYWGAQKDAVETGLAGHQIVLSLILYIGVPALLWTPVSGDEFVEAARQAHLVKKYELQAHADIAILRGSLLRAQEKAFIGFANLTIEEREELAGVMRGLVGGVDRTLREIGSSVNALAGTTRPFAMLGDNQDIQEILTYISGAIARGESPVYSEEDIENARAIILADKSRRRPAELPSDESIGDRLRRRSSLD